MMVGFADLYGTAGSGELDWRQFEAGLLFRSIVPKVRDCGDSGFRAIVSRLDVARGCQAIDVGAGGFVGFTTTRHLVEVLDAKVDAVEIDPDLARKLDEAFEGRINVVCAPIEAFDPGSKRYDLLVFDLPMIPYEFEVLLPAYADRLVDGGYALIDFTYDIPAMYDRSDPLMHPSTRADFERFMMARFGATAVDAHAAQRAFVGTPFTVRAIVDKWLGQSDRRGFGWLVLQKGDGRTRPGVGRLRRWLGMARDPS